LSGFFDLLNALLRIAPDVAGTLAACALFALYANARGSWAFKNAVVAIMKDRDEWKTMAQDAVKAQLDQAENQKAQAEQIKDLTEIVDRAMQTGGMRTRRER
jgi:hypothetical protein